MAARTNQKMKLLYIIEILEKYSDEENPINATELCARLEAVGVSAERKAIYNDIDTLIDFGYDIIKTRTPRFGYFMASRRFELPEVYLLSDAVRSAEFITPKKTRELISKLDSMLSVSQAKKREKGIYINGKTKCKNEEIYYSIDKISNAIENKKKIKLTYCQRALEEGKKIVIKEKLLTVSPYALIWENDKYYLVCNNAKYDNLMHLRLDRIKKAEITAEDFRHFSEVSEYTEFFDIADYTSKTFNMYSGDIEEIELKCSKRILEQIVDRFSDEIFIYKVTDDTFSFSVKAVISQGLISWILQYGADIEVISPDALKKGVIKTINEIKGMYKC
ncbi:MAG: transcriptional regulator [Clostridia bacterium]|nr:transcriptional regulator [Clostridia bacterium]